MDENKDCTGRMDKQTVVQEAIHTGAVKRIVVVIENICWGIVTVLRSCDRESQRLSYLPGARIEGIWWKNFENGSC